MQIKVLLGACVIVGVCIFGGQFAYEYHAKTQEIDKQLSRFGSAGIAISYEGIKAPNLSGGQFVVLNPVVKMDNGLVLSGEHALVSLSKLKQGAITLDKGTYTFNNGNTRIVGDFRGLHVTKYLLNHNAKDVEFTIEEVNARAQSSNEPLLDRAQVNCQYNEDKDENSLNVVMGQPSGDSFVLNLKDQPLKEMRNKSFWDKMLNQPIEKAQIEYTNVTSFNPITTQFPSIVTAINKFGLKFTNHHYPRSRRAGQSLLNFLRDQKSLAITINPKSGVNFSVKQIPLLYPVENMQIFDATGLEIY